MGKKDTNRDIAVCLDWDNGVLYSAGDRPSSHDSGSGGVTKTMR